MATMDLAGLIGKVKASGATTPEPVYQKLGEAITRIRESKGMSQRDFANLLEKGPSTVAEIETGATRILVSDVEKIATVLGVTPRQLMMGIWF